MALLLVDMSEDFCRAICEFFAQNQILHHILAQSGMTKAQVAALFNISPQTFTIWIIAAFIELCGHHALVWRELVRYAQQVRNAEVPISRKLQMFDLFSINPRLPEMFLRDLKESIPRDSYRP
jgi:hypothetical protein